MIITKNQLRKIIKNKLYETRFIVGDYDYEEGEEDENENENSSKNKKSTKLSAKNMSKNFKNKSHFIQFESNDEAKNFLLDIAGPDVFITFIDPYANENGQQSQKAPEFSLNPTAAFDTPHGFYFYPFDKKNCKKFFITKSPAEADFAITRPYFHLVRIDLNHKDVIIFHKDGTCNKNIQKKQYLKDLNELIRMHCAYYNKNEEDVDRDELLKALSLGTNYALRLQLPYLYTGQNDGDRIEENFKNNNYYKLYKAAYILSFKNLKGYYSSETESDQNQESDEPQTNSEFYSLLLNTIGIKCVIDIGSGTVHTNEPSQIHISTFGENDSFYEYIGTFKNNINVNSNDLEKYFADLDERQILIYYKNMPSPSCFDQSIVDCFFKFLHKNNHFMLKFINIIYEKIVLYILDTEERLEIANKMISKNFENWLKLHNNNTHAEKHLRKLLGINEKEDHNKHYNLEEWIAIFKEKSEEQIIDLLNKYVLKNFSGLEILQATKNIDKNIFKVIYKTIMNNHEFNKKIESDDITAKSIKNVLLNILTNVDINIFKSLLDESFDLFNDLNTIKSFIDKNINDLKRLETFFNYISNAKSNMSNEILQYIKNKSKMKNEAIKKLKLLIRHELKNILY